MVQYLILTANLFAIIVYMLIIFFLFAIKRRMSDKFKVTLIFLIIAFFALITVRGLHILREAEFDVSSFYYVDIIMASFFFLMGIIEFYRNVKGASSQNRPIKKAYHKKIYRNHELQRASIVYTNRLNEIEDKVKNMENKIKSGGIGSTEAIKMAERLRIQLDLLNRSYKGGYIGKSAYASGKNRIKRAYQHLRKKHL